MGEFELIEKFFKRPVRHAALGVGDDCALLNSAPGMQMAISTDMLVQGRHFFPDVDPYTLGHKALAVNLSDLAACGARPLACTLALALPEARSDWLEPFSRGLLDLADSYGCELIGGDTTQGPLNICVTVFGEVPVGQALLRSGARPGDDIYVSGNLGDAHLALQAMLGHIAIPPAALATARQRLEQPTPRIPLGMALRGVASAAADVSDGLLGDLGHILKQSSVGATVDTSIAIHLLAAYADPAGVNGHFGQEQWMALALHCVLAGGDDYELVFTAPVSRREDVAAAALEGDVAVTRLGQIEAAPGLRLVDAKGVAVENRFASFDHFAARKTTPDRAA